MSAASKKHMACVCSKTLPCVPKSAYGALNTELSVRSASPAVLQPELSCGGMRELWRAGEASRPRTLARPVTRLVRLCCPQQAADGSLSCALACHRAGTRSRCPPPPHLLPCPPPRRHPRMTLHGRRARGAVGAGVRGRATGSVRRPNCGRDRARNTGADGTLKAHCAGGAGRAPRQQTAIVQVCGLICDCECAKASKTKVIVIL